ncbi:unnamed protein product [Ophioblennius macclurei]
MDRMTSSVLCAVILLSCAVKLGVSQSMSCKGLCGGEFYRGNLCQCDYSCLTYGECCKDYESQCTTKDSCKGRCGETFKRGSLCSCDADCKKYKQCCSDFESNCAVEDPTLTTPDLYSPYSEGNQADDSSLSQDSLPPQPTEELADDVYSNIFDTDDFSNNGATDPEAIPIPDSSIDGYEVSTTDPLAQVSTEPTQSPQTSEITPEALGGVPTTDSTPLYGDEVLTDQPATEAVTTQSTEASDSSKTPPQTTTAPALDSNKPTSSSEPEVEPTNSASTSEGQTAEQVETQPTEASFPSDEPEATSVPSSTQNSVTTLENSQVTTTPPPSTPELTTIQEETTSNSNSDSSSGDVASNPTSLPADPEGAVTSASPPGSSVSTDVNDATTHMISSTAVAQDVTTKETMSEPAHATSKPTSPSKPELKPQENPDPTSQDKPDLNPQDKPELNPQDNPEPTSQDKPDPNPQDNPKPTSQNNPEPTSQNKPDPNPQDNPEPTSQDKPDLNPQDNPEPTSQDKPDLNPQDNPKPTSQDKPELNPQNNPEPTSQNKPELNPQDKPNPQKPIAAKPSMKPMPKPQIMVQTLNTNGQNDYQSDENHDTDLCSGRPIGGVTTLRNGTIVVFRGHYFWNLDSNRVPGPAQGITQVWGVPSPIDTVFTRCNCQGKTYIFKGGKYWRYENDVLDTGYPRAVQTGFDGLQGHITGALSVPQYQSRGESVYFFKRGGTVQKYSYQFGTSPSCGKKVQYTIYTVRNRRVRQAVSVLGPTINIRTSWRGFPATVTAAASIPNSREPEGYKYYVFSRTKSYQVRLSGARPVLASTAVGTTSQNDIFKCPQKASLKNTN